MSLLPSLKSRQRLLDSITASIVNRIQIRYCIYAALARIIREITGIPNPYPFGQDLTGQSPVFQEQLGLALFTDKHIRHSIL